MKQFAMLTAVLLFAAPALAGMDVHVDDVVKVPPGGYNNALLSGPMTIYNQTTGEDFLTFCVEVDELIMVPLDYNVSSIGTMTVASGMHMSERTAWLYANYRDGSLQGYADADADNDALQYAIWRSMGYSHQYLLDNYNHFDVSDAHALAESNDWWVDSLVDPFSVAGWTGYANVRVASINLNSPSELLGQDFLVLVPTPGAALLGMLGLGLIGWLRRPHA